MEQTDNRDFRSGPPGEFYYRPAREKQEKGGPKKWVIGIFLILILAIGAWWYFKRTEQQKQGKQIEIVGKDQQPKDYPIANSGEVSPISGLPCESWKRRPLAVMQPSDVQARPAAGFSEADMVIEMPVITASITRLMGVYVCNLPSEVGSMRSARHDFIHLAKGLDAIFAPWGRSESHSDSDKFGLARGILDSGAIDSINCNGDAGKSAYACSVGSQACFRKEGMDRGVDSGYGNPKMMLKCAEEFGYRMENKFSGYPHKEELPLDQRIQKGYLRIGFAGAYEVEYNYDRESNSYLRVWAGNPDTDRNNGKRIAPKNVVVMIASSEQIEGQYNNLQLGDPWYDATDSGEARFYLDGQEIRGGWKKSKSSVDSKLIFTDQNGNDVKFVPGQIWVEVLEPGQALKWRINEEIGA